jgi:hypothetical protein
MNNKTIKKRKINKVNDHCTPKKKEKKRKDTEWKNFLKYNGCGANINLTEYK